MVMEVGKNHVFLYIYKQKTSGIHTNLQKNMSTFVNACRFQTKAMRLEGKLGKHEYERND